MKKRSLLFLFMFLLSFTTFAQQKTVTDFYVDKWELKFIGTPNGDGVMHANIDRKEGQLTGTLSDPSGQSEPTPINKIEENDDGIVLYFTAQGFDVGVDLKKIDDNTLKGTMMNMFESTMKRMKDGVVLSPSNDSQTNSTQPKVEIPKSNQPKAFGTESSLYYGATWQADKSKIRNPKSQIDWFPQYDFDAKQFEAAPRPFGPSTRWWWPGNDVTDEELRREVKLLAEHGFAGVEIQPFAGAINRDTDKATQDRIFSWNSPSFYEHLEAVMKQAKASEVVVDLNGGSGWPIGGQFFDPQVSMRSLAVVDSALQAGSTYKGQIPMIPTKTVGRMGTAGNIVKSEWGVMLSVVAAKTLQADKKQVVLNKNAIVDLTNMVKDKQLTWQVPAEGNWRLVVTWSIPSGEQPSLIAQRGSNYVVDHLDPSILTKTYDYLLGERTGLEKYHGNPLRAVFNDSYEFHVHRIVSPDIKEAFKKLNGYDITPYLSTVFKKGYNHPTYLGAQYFKEPIPYMIDPENHWRLMYDYDLAVNEVFKQHFIKTSNQWLRQRGMLHRTQAYGFPLDPIGSAGAADLPETEQLFAQGSEGALKLATSGAHLYNRPIVSQESFVSILKAEMTTPQKIKAWADKSLAAGVNHFIYHGTPYKYNPGGYPEEGWNPWSSPYMPFINFSANLNESNPFWQDLKSINTYLTRAQYALRAGKPQHEVLIYMPFINYAENEVNPNPSEILAAGYFEGVEPLITDPGAATKGQVYEWYEQLWPTINELESKGITWEFVNDESLQKATWKNGRLSINGNDYQTLVLSHLPYIYLKTAQKIKVLSQQGATIWAVGNAPTQQPSYNDFAKRDAEAKKIMQEVWAAKSTSVINGNLPTNNIEQKIRFAETTDWSRQINRQMSDGSILKFIANQSGEWHTIQLTIDNSLPNVYWLDAETGKAIKVTGNKASYRLAPYGSIFLVASKKALDIEAFAPITDEGNTLATLEKWNIKVGNNTFDNSPLFDWRTKEATKFSSDKGIYTTSFNIQDKSQEQGYYLDLGEVYYTALVKVNGKIVGKRIYAPYKLDITDFVQKGDNTLEIAITTSRRNGFVGEAVKGNKGYIQFNNKENTIVPSGLVGPVKVQEGPLRKERRADNLHLTPATSSIDNIKNGEAIPLYAAGKLPNSKLSTTEENTFSFPSPDDNPRRFIVNTSQPELTVWLPPKEKNIGVAVVICPGGGYSGTAIDHEGHHIAQKLNEHGIAGFVLKYRTPRTDLVDNKEIVPLQDAQRAIQMVRENATAWGLNPNKVGIMGSSAGGHLASTAGTHFQKAQIENPRGTSLRPDFMVLNYPVISFADSLAHYGSRFNLIGEMPIEELQKIMADWQNSEKRLASLPVDEAKKAHYSNELQVTAHTPPTFITHANDDDVVKVQNAILFIAALQKHKVPVASFFYANGGHGYGMDNPTSEVEWIDACIDWILNRQKKPSKITQINTENKRKILFNTGWKFVRDSLVGAEQVAFDDVNWMDVDVPHDYSIMGLPGDDTQEQIGPFSKKSPGNGNSTGHVLGGTGWYRKTFMLDPAAEGKTVIIKFDGVYMESEVWVNGKKVGINRNGYTPFWFDITPLLKKAGEPNVVAVKVDNAGRNSRWYSGSGIYRNVHLVVTNPVHVGVWGANITTPEINTKSAIVDVELTLQNKKERQVDAEITIHIKDKKGTLVSTAVHNLALPARAESVSKKQLKVDDPALWSVESPNQYEAEITIKTENKVADIYHQTFGIRSIEVSAEKGFLLNGKPILLKGGCLHHDNGLLGAAAFDRAEIRKVELMKANGYNAIRFSHYPPSEVFLNACDELGMLVIDEFTDMWESYKNPLDYSRFFEEDWHKDLTNMIVRDRNHPSIIMWSIGNEILKNSVEDGVRIGKQLAKRVKELDKSRFVTEAITHVFTPEGWESSGPIFELLDISGYNYQNNRYETDHAKFPQRIMYGSESFPYNAYDYWKQAEQHPYVIGDFVWTAMDYLGEVALAHIKYVPETQKVEFQLPENLKLPPGYNVFDIMQKMPSEWPHYLAWSGDLDIIGEKKPQSLYRDVLWDESPIEVNVHEYIPDGMAENISGWGWPKEWSHWNWKGNEGKSLQVRVFTKASQVKLLLNGKTIGEKTLTEEDKYVASFEVPYQAGELKAIAMDKGKERASKILKTTGKPAKIKLHTDRSQITADRNDLAFVVIEVLDENGQVVPHNSVKLKLSLSGNGELVASGNAGMDGMESFNKPIITTYQGRAQAVIRPFATSGGIKLLVESEGLPRAEIAIQVD